MEVAMPQKLGSRGFGVIGVIVVMGVVAVIGLGGWAIYRHEHKANTTVGSTQKTKKITTNSKTSSPSRSNAPTPILGEPWAPTQEGYGTVKPTSISNGGDPTGIATNVTWQSWGGPQATGQGMSTYVPSNATVSDGIAAQATIVAFNLSTCQGKTAYTAIEWYFSQHGGSFNPSRYINICTGEYVGY